MRPPAEEGVERPVQRLGAEPLVEELGQDAGEDDAPAMRV